MTIQPLPNMLQTAETWNIAIAVMIVISGYAALALSLAIGAVNYIKSHPRQYDDYIDETFVFLTLDRMEFEPEYWLDYGYFRNQSQSFFRNNLSAEYGITEHWMMDGRGTWQSNINGHTFFSGGRIESRFRFGEENDLPIDFAASLEVAGEREIMDEWNYALEPRLILSKDFSEKTNMTLNITEAISLNNQPSAFNASLGFREYLSQKVRVGSEFKYDFEKKMGSCVPQVWFVFAHDRILKTGGCTTNSTIHSK